MYAGLRTLIVYVCAQKSYRVYNIYGLGKRFASPKKRCTGRAKSYTAVLAFISLLDVASREMPTAYTMVTADVTVFQFQFQSFQPKTSLFVFSLSAKNQPLRFFLRYSKEGHAGVLLSSIGTHYAGITRHL